MTKSVGVGDPIWVVVEKKELQPPHSIEKHTIAGVDVLLADEDGNWYYANLDSGEYRDGFAFFTNRQDAEDFRDKQKIDDLYGDME